MHMLLCIEKEKDDDELDNHEDTIKLERRGGGEKKSGTNSKTLLSNSGA